MDGCAARAVARESGDERVNLSIIAARGSDRRP
jgi:hypothetical protein